MMIFTSARASRLAAAALFAALLAIAPAALRAQTTATAVSAKSADTATTAAEVCVVSGEPLGSMGEPYSIQHEGRTVRFCCKACVDQFKQDPEKYLKKLDEEIISNQGKTYPTTACIVSGKELPAGGGKQVVVNNQLVRLCCGGCESMLKADPDKYLDKLSPKSGAGNP